MIRVVHNFYEATSENVQLICDLERIERELQIQYFTTRKQTQITDFFNTYQKMWVAYCTYVLYMFYVVFCMGGSSGDVSENPVA